MWATGGYCASQGNSVADEWIQTVVLGSINNNSGTNGGYGDFKHDFTGEIARNQNYAIILKAGFASSSYNEY